MNHKTPIKELIETLRLVDRYGLQGAATIQGFTPQCIGQRVRRLERQVGIQFFTGYDYNRMTYQGKEYLRGIDNG